jgi:hypothetical protein
MAISLYLSDNLSHFILDLTAIGFHCPYISHDFIPNKAIADDQTYAPTTIIPYLTIGSHLADNTTS